MPLNLLTANFYFIPFVASIIGWRSSLQNLPYRRHLNDWHYASRKICFSRSYIGINHSPIQNPFSSSGVFRLVFIYLYGKYNGLGNTQWLNQIPTPLVIILNSLFTNKAVAASPCITDIVIEISHHTIYIAFGKGLKRIFLQNQPHSYLIFRWLVFYCWRLPPQCIFCFCRFNFWFSFTNYFS